MLNTDTKLREFKVGYNKTETQDGLFTDFDNPPFYDTSISSIGNLDPGSIADATRITEYPYKIWNDFHKKSVKSITLNSGGSGYSTAPTVSFIGGALENTGPFQILGRSNSGTTSGTYGYFYPLFSSQQKANIAINKKKFDDEIINEDIDEHPRNGITINDLSKLNSVFKEKGTVTPGNSSGINDGAAAVVLTKRELAEKHNLEILGKIISWATCGVDPSMMGLGPIPSSNKALEIAKWNVKDLDLIEINEAFAAQSIAVIKELKVPKEKVNVNGGAIALGHPIGASGARIVVTLLNELKKISGKKGLATLCIGGGMGISMCIEKD